ncbi:MAG: flavodoxin family protein [Bacillota bacterium]
MKIVAVNGSHRKGKNTARMLLEVLAGARAGGAETELIELMEYDIRFCRACNHCLQETRCSIRDDMDVIGPKLLDADGIVLGSPAYWVNVTAAMKNFMDRTRWMHMRENLLEGRVGAVVTHAALRNGGQELAAHALEKFLRGHGLILVDGRGPGGPIYNTGAFGTMFDGLDGERLLYKKSVAEDDLAMRFCKQMGRNMVHMIKKIRRCDS